MAGTLVTFCLLAYAATALLANGSLSDFDQALLPQSEFRSSRLLR